MRIILILALCLAVVLAADLERSREDRPAYQRRQERKAGKRNKEERPAYKKRQERKDKKKRRREDKDGPRDKKKLAEIDQEDDKPAEQSDKVKEDKPAKQKRQERKQEKREKEETLAHKRRHER